MAEPEAAPAGSWHPRKQRATRGSSLIGEKELQLDAKSAAAAADARSDDKTPRVVLSARRRLASACARARAAWARYAGSDKVQQAGSRVSATAAALTRMGTRLADRIPQTPAKRALLAICLVYVTYALLSSSLATLRGWWRSHFGGNIVIILASSQGGGVMRWKSPNEWALEYTSIANKKHYAGLQGYELDVRDIPQMKRYTHEWRESWEKVDTIRAALRAHPKAEWLWWMDLTTFIMEPQYSVEGHIFEAVRKFGVRDITADGAFNPLSIQPLGGVDWDADVNMILSQDCGGFNLGSFLLRPGDWTNRLLDIWWDPVFYEQKHMEWEHKEQDALEYLYTTQPWIRSGIMFVPQRTLNSFPHGACAEFSSDPRYFYNTQDRDFIVNLAGCEWGRDCLGEMVHFRDLSKRLHSGWF